MKDLDNLLPLKPEGKGSKKIQNRGKSFGYQILGFGSGGAVTAFATDFLVVAGGGAGGTYNHGAGAGAGGFRTSAGPSGGGGSAECSLTLNSGVTFPNSEGTRSDSSKPLGRRIF